MIKVIVAHQHRLVRQALAKILSLQKSVSIVGDADSGPEILKLAEKSKPDVIVVDSDLSGLNGELGECDHPKPEMIVFPRRQRATDGDLVNHLTYDTDINTLVDAVLSVAGEDIRDEDDDLRCQEALDNLTNREKQVLALLADGLSNKQIARQMVITERTVKYHISNILKKLDLFSRTEAAVAFLKSNLA